MTIPQSIIEKIDKGDATYNCCALGGSGAYSIPVPENKYIIIFGFTFNHFIQKRNGLLEDSDKLLHVIHHVQFQSKTQRFLYNFRTLLQQIVVLVGDTKQSNLLPSNGAETIECYQKHQSDVNISVWNMTPAYRWSREYRQPPVDVMSTLEHAPLGYRGVEMVYKIHPDPLVDPLWQTNPLNNKNNPEDGARFSFVSPINENNILPNVDIDSVDALYQIPLINVYYAIVNKPTKSTHRN